jgi:hypothetical protein
MLIHVFTCPCPIPEKIIWTSLDNERNYRDNHYRDIIKLTRKWLDDLLSGGSFYKKNKIFFTRKLEAIYFILRMNSRNSIINTFFYAKCKSRHMPNIISDRISEIFVHKFERYFNHSMVTDFLDLIARTDIKRLYNYNDFHYLDDICDFVFSKIVNNKETGEQGTAFSFKGRTLKSVIRLMNEWHLNLLNEIEGVENLENLDIPSFLRSSNFQIYKWDGLSLADYQCKTNNYTWVVSELRNSLSLYREGQKMRHCVVSYAQRCASGECSIFNISCKHKENNTIESMATLEINTSTKTLVQARGKFNHTVTDETMSIITQWTKENGIVIDLRYR